MSATSTLIPVLTATPQQTAFLAALTDSTDNILLRARAGTGKTSAILMGVDAYTAKFPSHEILVLAYNKAIADEVSDKLKQRGHTDWHTVQACTLHSLGFGLLRFAFRAEVDDKKVAKLIRAHETDDPDFYAYSAQISALVRYAKQAGVGFFPDAQIGDTRVWYDLAEHFDVNGFEDTTESDVVVACAQAIYRESLADTHTVDFDDMILMPLVKSLRVKFTKDIIFLDEAQDLSRARQALARKFMRPRTGRMIVVGDDNQAIYGFSGADALALSNLAESLGAVTLPLSITWRCPRAVVELAQKTVPDFQAAATAPQGEVLYVDSLPSDLTPGYGRDVILCRNTAPLIDIAYRLIREGKPAKVDGRAIGDGLVTLARRWKVKTTDALSNKLSDYLARETQKAQAKGNEQRAADVADRVETLLQIIGEVNRKGLHSVDSVVSHIDSLFIDGADNVITLATYHRSKGREWNRVCLWEHSTRCPSRAARQAWQREQEANLAYVAFTRAKETLVFVR